MNERQPGDVRILVVDDEPDFRDLLVFSFKRLGYQVFSASNGREAFEFVKANPVDVVVSDIRMPDGDGIEFLDRTKEWRPETPIILLVTGYAELTAEEAHEKGAEALFSKPLDRKALNDAIARLLLPPGQRWSQNSERVDTDLKVGLQFESLGEAIEAKVINLGRGGMFVSLPAGRYPNVNDIVGFKIVFNPTETSMQGSGIVRWARTKNVASFPAGCGIEFTYLDEAAKTKIIEFLNIAKPQAFIPSR